MALTAVVGQARAADGREAAAQATHRALEKLGRSPVGLGLVITSYDYPVPLVAGSVSALLGDAPIWGFSTSAELTNDGRAQRSVIVGLLSGSDLQARADWWPGFSDDSRGVTQKMAQALQLYQSSGALLAVADGINGDARQLCAALPAGNYALAGGLAGGDLRRARTFQIGGRQNGNGGLAAALLTGKLAMGVGQGHGWLPVGVHFRVTRARGPWVRSLDSRSAAESYARYLGYKPREWGFPPLNELVRLYPLGIEQAAGGGRLTDKENLLLRAPLRIENDGSLRMNTTIPEGSVGHLMVGSIDACLQAVQDAAGQARQALGNARPVLALVLLDVAWQMLFEAQPGAEINALRDVLGPDLPVAGGYTFGQIARNSAGVPELFNQEIQVILFGEPA